MSGESYDAICFGFKSHLGTTSLYFVVMFNSFLEESYVFGEVTVKNNLAVID